jgi:hypothetical protein
MLTTQATTSSVQAGHAPIGGGAASPRSRRVDGVIACGVLACSLMLAAGCTVSRPSSYEVFATPMGAHFTPAEVGGRSPLQMAAEVACRLRLSNSLEWFETAPGRFSGDLRDSDYSYDLIPGRGWMRLIHTRTTMRAVTISAAPSPTEPDAILVSAVFPWARDTKATLSWNRWAQLALVGDRIRGSWGDAIAETEESRPVEGEEARLAQEMFVRHCRSRGCGVGIDRWVVYTFEDSKAD